MGIWGQGVGSCHAVPCHTALAGMRAVPQVGGRCPEPGGSRGMPRAVQESGASAPRAAWSARCLLGE